MVRRLPSLWVGNCAMGADFLAVHCASLHPRRPTFNANLAGKITSIFRAILLPQEGSFAIVTNIEGRMRWTRTPHDAAWPRVHPRNSPREQPEWNPTDPCAGVWRDGNVFICGRGVDQLYEV
jgi:hypothetical protein